MKNSKILSAFIFFLITLPCSIFSDTVYLKNGQELNGTITAQTRVQIKITINGESRTIKKTDIRRIQFGKLPEKPAEPVETEQEKQLREKKEKEEQKKQAEEEVRRQKEAEEKRIAEEAQKQKEEEKRLKAEAEEKEKEKKRLAAEEEKKQKESAIDEKQKAKRERIERLANKHFLSIGASAGKADHHFTTENIHNDFYKNLNFFYLDTANEWENTDMNVGTLMFMYNWKRIFFDLEFQTGKAQPEYSSFQKLETPDKTDPYFEIFPYHEKFDLKYFHGTFTAGYKFFPFANFEISPILTFQKSEVKGKSSLTGMGIVSSPILAASFISANENENSYNGKTYMGGLKINYAFKAPFEISFALQHRTTNSNYHYTIHKTGFTQTNPVFEIMSFSFEIKGLIIRKGTDAALKMQYNKESWNTSFFIKFEGYRESGKFIKTNNKILPTPSLQKPKAPADDPGSILNAAFNSSGFKDNTESLEKHAAVSLGVTYNFDFKK